MIGQLLEEILEEHNVRYIAVTDNIDSLKGLDDMVAVRDLFNEWYARDTSKKIRAVWRAKSSAGKRLCNNPPYGYRKDPEDKERWLVDEEAAKVVQEIFSLCIAGLGPMQIAKRLQKEQVLNPTAYREAHGLIVGNPIPADPYHWDNKAVAAILERMEYLGHTVNFKGTKEISYKSKKRIKNPPEKWQVLPDTHPAIIEQAQLGQGAGTPQEQASPYKDGQAQSIFRAGGVCRLRGKAVLLHYQLFRGTARPLCMLQLQEQHGDLLGPLYSGCGAGTSAKDSPVCAGIRK